MATSGNYTLSLSVNEAAQQAYELLQVAADGESLDGDMFADFKKWGNTLLKAWQTNGLQPYLQTEGTLFLTRGQAEYDFRLAATKKSNEWFETTTTAATTASAYVIPVTSATNIQADDVIGIIQNDNNLFWTTVVRVSTLNITVKDAIPLATLSGSEVRNYRDTFYPISRIIDVRRKEGDDYEIPIEFKSRADYYNLPNKSQEGTPIQAFYDRQDVAGEKYGVMYIWSPPVTTVPVINFTYERKLQVITDPDETLDIPEYAQEAFIFSVAEKLLYKYGASPERINMIKQDAFVARENMLSFDAESYPIEVTMRNYG
jgi:hypothetical protein